METFVERRSFLPKSSSRSNKVNNTARQKLGRISNSNRTPILNDYFCWGTAFIFVTFSFISGTLSGNLDVQEANHMEMIRMKKSFLFGRSNSSNGTKSVRVPNQHDHRLAGLQCDKWGGPSLNAAQEMVYWEDIPSDEQYLSPFHPEANKDETGSTELRIDQFLTFEPDGGGWNNIRMAMETILVSEAAQFLTLSTQNSVLCA